LTKEKHFSILGFLASGTKMLQNEKSTAVTE
jgi:hypothetical protein